MVTIGTSSSQITVLCLIYLIRTFFDEWHLILTGFMTRILLQNIENVKNMWIFWYWLKKLRRAPGTWGWHLKDSFCPGELLMWSINTMFPMALKEDSVAGLVLEDHGHKVNVWISMSTMSRKILVTRWTCWSVSPAELLCFSCACSPVSVRWLSCHELWNALQNWSLSPLSPYHHNVHAVAKEGTGITPWPGRSVLWCLKNISIKCQKVQLTSDLI